MAQTIKIKRSNTTAAPTSLGAGELAYSSSSNKLFIGHPSSAAVTTIGGEVYVNMLDHTAGTLTASSAILVDANSKIDSLKSGNIVVTGSSDTISTGSGALTIAPAGNLIITHGGTLDLDGQANSLTIPDNQAAALDINEGGNSYMKFITTNGSEEIEIAKAVDLNNTLNVSSAVTLGASLDVTTTLGVDGNFDVATNKFTVNASSGNTAVAGTLAVTSDITGSADLTISGDTALNGAITLGNASSDAITVTGTPTFGASADFDAGLTVASSQTVDFGSNRLQNVATPTSSTDAANKSYVDSVKQALDIKDSVRVGTTANLSASYNNGSSGVGATLTGDSNGALSVDGVTPSAGDRILVKDQSSAAHNGIYSVTTVGDGSNAFVLTRVTDADSSTQVTGGLFTFVEEGSNNADNAYVLTSVTGTATLGSDNLIFTQFSGAGQISGGAGLAKSGNTLSVNVDDKAIEINSDTLRLKGITATANGDILFGANGANGGYSRLSIGTYDSTNSVGQILQVGASSTVTWSNTLDGGTF